MKTSWPKPLTAWILGLLAIVPFPAFATAYLYGAEEHAAFRAATLLSYSGVVLAFLGGSRWGREITLERPRWSVLVPAMLVLAIAWGLAAWPERLPIEWRIGGFIGGFLVVWLWDAVSVGIPTWYHRLRTVLTAVACTSLAFALERAVHLRALVESVSGY